MLGAEALKVYEAEIDESLYESEVPAIAETREEAGLGERSEKGEGTRFYT